jgi:hypothetical protein
MRIESKVMSISWIPMEAVQGALRAGFDLKVAHYDPPPPDRIYSIEEVHRLCSEDAFRFANVLSAWIEVEDGRITGFGRTADSGLVIGSTTVRIAQAGATLRAIGLPELQPEPVVEDTSVQFVQTVGGRTGVPLPRPVRHAPFVQWRAPIVWTTLAMTIHADGRTDLELAGASTFPRHWVYDNDGALSLKSGVTDQKSWVAESFGDRTPWGDQDSPVVVAAVETDLERQISADIMEPGGKLEVRRLEEGAVVTRQGEPGDELFLLLDGILVVEVDGERVAEVGPGAVLGERALVEEGLRASTLVAITPVRLAVANVDVIDLRRLKELARHHGWRGDD